MSYRVLVNEFAAKIFSMGILVAGVLCHPLTPGYPICREIRCRDVRAIIFSNGIKIFFKKTSSNDVSRVTYGLFLIITDRLALICRLQRS